MMRRITFLAIIMISFTFNAMAEETFNDMVNDLIERSVPLVNTKQLSEKVKARKKIYILDARENNEFNVSRIKNAIHVGYDDFSMTSVQRIPLDAEIIIYCSIGYRSEKIGEKLKKSGYANVYNLYGGIFAWVNDGQPVYDSNGKLTSRVHAYNKKWGRWITKGEKVYD